MANRREKSGSSDRCYFLGLQNHLGDCSHEFPQKESYDKPRQHIKKQRHHFVDKGPSSQSYGFSSNHVWMWELDHKEGWVSRIDALELCCRRRLLRAPWTAREIKPINHNGNQPWIFIGRTDAEATAPILWPLNVKSRLIGKDLDAGKGGEEGDREWDGWMASLTQRTWVWASSGSWWWTGKPGVLQSMGSQRVGHDWATELNWMKMLVKKKKPFAVILEFSSWGANLKSNSNNMDNMKYILGILLCFASQEI